MKNSFGVYSIVWALALLMFNVVTFVVPNEINGVSRWTGIFWVSYAFITAAFLGQLLCAHFAFKPSTNQKLFYRIPMIRVSYIGLIVMLIAGGVFMAVPVLPCWIGIIVCAIILIVCAMYVIRATVLANIISNMDDKTKERIAFMALLAIEAKSISFSAPNEELANLALKLHEETKYSDMTSPIGIEEANASLKAKLKEFKAAVEGGDGELANEVAEQYIALLKTRNELCKSLK